MYRTNSAGPSIFIVMVKIIIITIIYLRSTWFDTVTINCIARAVKLRKDRWSSKQQKNSLLRRGKMWDRFPLLWHERQLPPCFGRGLHSSTFSQTLYCGRQAGQTESGGNMKGGRGNTVRWLDWGTTGKGKKEKGRGFKNYILVLTSTRDEVSLSAYRPRDGLETWFWMSWFLRSANNWLRVSLPRMEL